jgi:hypothetical protein
MSDETKYTIKQFISAIEGLSNATPHSDTMELPTGHNSFKEMWIGWLEEYLTPGYYDRMNIVDDAQWAYQHLNNGGMIVWLNEAAGEAPRLIEAALAAMEGRDAEPTKAKYARRVLPWDDLAKRLFRRRPAAA